MCGTITKIFFYFSKLCKNTKIYRHTMWCVSDRVARFSLFPMNSLAIFSNPSFFSVLINIVDHVATFRSDWKPSERNCAHEWTRRADCREIQMIFFQCSFPRARFWAVLFFIQISFGQNINIFINKKNSLKKKINLKKSIN